MIRSKCLVVMFTMLLAIAAHAQEQGKIDARCEKILPAAVVAAGAEAKDVKLVPYDPMKGAGGHCNYATASGLLMLMTIDPSGGAKGFASQKANKTYAINQKSVSGVGDEAFTTYSNKPLGLSILVMRKGNAVYSLSSFMDAKSFKPMLDDRQLTQIAKKVR